MITCFGWTYEYIEQNIDLPRYYAIMEYQDSFPPVHQMMAAYFGIKPKASNNNNGKTEQKFDEVIYELLNTASTQPNNKKNKGIRML